ncbi:hypothetical protein PF005_g19383 [Phytophthora fragariae]|uniref:Uncharacterized protein n=1 Tax=Phytophthora fragariae TaxID=53985 RepID=A0A6A3WRX3_9STRA|nr:hypothetical protein PF003_g24332 [Phytophthora fragariae]KAE8931483.1 hypothetical protein PF009_g18455 [Phytophthora fragariae]KAE8990972.1 hypothetical protein PF011_g18128 [Phytophthora fragariae]KAE9095166.1 hypothetical protein PF010_g16810 [Phytophthora fragariae]KAE9097564.1 hypothetical protein PF007_g16566 [Phytophthora fragariae]
MRMAPETALTSVIASELKALLMELRHGYRRWSDPSRPEPNSNLVNIYGVRVTRCLICGLYGLFQCLRSQTVGLSGSAIGPRRFGW